MIVSGWRMAGFRFAWIFLSCFLCGLCDLSVLCVKSFDFRPSEIQRLLTQSAQRSQRKAKRENQDNPATYNLLPDTFLPRLAPFARFTIAAALFLRL
jgi:hypothetical protein